VEIRLRASFWAVPAFSLVEPVSTSGPVSNRIPRSASSRSGVLGLLAIPHVQTPFCRA
jgi:hypothetical protein